MHIPGSGIINFVFRYQRNITLKPKQYQNKTFKGLYVDEMSNESNLCYVPSKLLR